MIGINYPIWFYIIGLWSLIWKGIALWRTAHNEQKIWFVVLLVINTFGILELVYLFKFAKNPLTIGEIKSWKKLLRRPQK
ncbi:MAG: DUF5652 family protein [Patescibacteria group bacterium]